MKVTTTTALNEHWTPMERMSARGQLMTYGRIFLDSSTKRPVSDDWLYTKLPEYLRKEQGNEAA